MYGGNLNNQSTNKTNNKERIQHPSLSEITWRNIFEHSKNLVLEGGGNMIITRKKKVVKSDLGKNWYRKTQELF
ncbi:hypothetical protein LEP1GSC068_0483 [Leptospira sp. Fiocruz LV3954]|nr:hypothetical protein LEP1GSC068_0483 [Leptospira sp. Fiocruz LV3954]